MHPRPAPLSPFPSRPRPPPGGIETAPPSAPPFLPSFFLLPLARPSSSSSTSSFSSSPMSYPVNDNPFDEAGFLYVLGFRRLLGGAAAHILIVRS